MPVPKPKKGESKDKFISRCMGDELMQEYEQEQRAGICYTAWKTKNKKNETNSELVSVVANLDLSSIRAETWMDKNYLVAPVVMAVEGVMNSLLYPAFELSKFVGSWNGRPLTLFHPKDEQGEFISANDSRVKAEEVHMGIVRNARYEEGLRAEAWLEIDRAKAIRPEIIEYWKGKKTRLEVSTGLWGDVVPVPGEWKGKKYDGIMTNIRPDHLALLPGGKGACSWNDGCGIRDNEDPDESPTCNLTIGDLQLSLQKVLSAKNVKTASERREHHLEEVDLTKKQVIYRYTRSIWMDGITTYSETRLYRQPYAVEDGEVKLEGEPIEVKKVVSYKDVTKNNSSKEEKEEQNMTDKQTKTSKEERIDALIACQRCRYQEKDREFLQGLSEEQLELISPPDNVIVRPEEPSVTIANDDKTSGPEDENPGKAVSVISWLNDQKNMPLEIKETLSQALILNQQTKLELITILMKHPRNKFTQEQLSGKTVSELRALTELAGPTEDPTKSESTSSFFGMKLATSQPSDTDKGKVEPLTVVNLVDVFKEQRKVAK